MRNGIEARPLNAALVFSGPINEACKVGVGFSPLLAYAVAWRETIEEYGSGAATVMADNGDGGHGLFQLTSSFPDNWKSAYVNALYAVREFLLPAETYWAHELQGGDLVRAIAAEFNAGRTATIAAHEAGDVDKATTNGYAHAVQGFYLNLCAIGHP